MAITISDVKTMLDETTLNLGDLCKSPNVNKWSKWKPIKSSKVEGITADDIKRARAGLGLTNITERWRKMLGYADATTYSKEQCLAAITECYYDRPNGGTTSPFRLGDFRDYRHDTSRTDEWQEYMYVKASDLGVYAKTTYSSTAFSGQVNPNNSWTWVWNHPLRSFGIMGMQLDDSGASSGVIGSGVSPHAIPITWIGGDGLLGATYRLAIAVWVNSSTVVTFCSGRPLVASSDNSVRGLLIPDFSTNTKGAETLYNACHTTGNTTFQCTPFLISDVGLGFVAKGSSTYNTTGPTVKSSSVIYAMPSGTKSFNLVIQGGTSGEGSANQQGRMPEVDRLSPTYWRNGWAVAAVRVAKSGTGSNAYPINAIVLYTDKYYAGSSCTAQITYSFEDKGQRKEETTIASYTIKEGDTGTVTTLEGGLTTGTYYGKALDARLKLSLTSVEFW